MNSKLLRTCMVLWVLGLAGMVLTRALLHQEPGDLGFEACTRLWGLGGLGYVGLGAAQLLGASGRGA